MSRDSVPETKPDLLLQRYREANALDPARPGPALRDAVLAQARQLANNRLPAAAAPARAAANDSAWNWKALGSLAMIGLMGLLMLQFERGNPEEKATAFGTSVPTDAPSPAVSARGNGFDNPPAEAAAAPTETVLTSPQPSRSPGKAPTAARTTVPAQQPVWVSPQAPPVRADAPKSVEARAREAAAETAAPPPSPVPSDIAASDATALAQVQAPLASAAPAMGAMQDLARERRSLAAAPAALTALLAAIEGNDAERVRQRLAEGANPNQRDGVSRTPLMAAAQRGNAEIVRLLRAAGADPTLRDAQGLSAADLAERAGHPALLPLLQ